MDVMSITLSYFCGGMATADRIGPSGGMDGSDQRGYSSVSLRTFQDPVFGRSASDAGEFPFATVTITITIVTAVTVTIVVVVALARRAG